MVQLLWKTVVNFPSKIKHILVIWLKNPTQGISAGEKETCPHVSTKLYVNIVALFLLSQTVKNLDVHQLLQTKTVIHADTEIIQSKKGANYRLMQHHGWISKALCQVKKARYKSKLLYYPISIIFRRGNTTGSDNRAEDAEGWEGGETDYMGGRREFMGWRKHSVFWFYWWFDNCNSLK